MSKANINPKIKVTYDNICFCFLILLLNIGTSSVSAGAYNFIFIIPKTVIIASKTYFAILSITIVFDKNATPQ